MRRIAETAAAVAPGRKPWSERIVLGCWSVSTEYRHLMPLANGTPESSQTPWDPEHILTAASYRQSTYHLRENIFQIIR